MLVQYVKFLATCKLDLVGAPVLLRLAFELSCVGTRNFALGERARIVLMQHLCLDTLIKYAAVRIKFLHIRPSFLANCLSLISFLLFSIAISLKSYPALVSLYFTTTVSETRGSA